MEGKHGRSRGWHYPGRGMSGDGEELVGITVMSCAQHRWFLPTLVRTSDRDKTQTYIRLLTAGRKKSTRSRHSVGCKIEEILRLAARWNPTTTYLRASQLSLRGTDTGWVQEEERCRLTTGSTVLHWDGSFLVALGFLPLTVVAVGAAVAGADRPVGAITSDAVAGAARRATAVQADSIELAFILAFVWERGREMRCIP